MRVVIVEDEALLRQGLSSLLAGAGVDVVATAGDAPSAREAVRAHRPDVLVTDIRIPPAYATDGLDTALELRAALPDLAVMVLSQYVARPYAERLIAAGPRGLGYQLKQRVSNVPTFVADLHTIAGGGTALDPDVVGLLLGPARSGAAPGSPLDGLTRLTPRQHEVLGLLAEGRSNAAIAARLHISEKAVVAHVSRIYTELDLPEHDDDHRRVLAVLRYLSPAAR